MKLFSQSNQFISQNVSMCLKNISLVLLIAIFSCSQRKSAALAGEGNVTSGGTQPSKLEFEWTAVKTILDDPTIRADISKHADHFKTEILGIKKVNGQSAVWSIQTDICEIEVQFVAKCGPNSPFCDFSTKLLKPCVPTSVQIQ
ncbi:MAG: hypothetical protein NT027_05150 [Proteobacteria bacterium]|nr:hypothetical protein [Pseudomonadota bacterium]